MTKKQRQEFFESQFRVAINELKETGLTKGHFRMSLEEWSDDCLLGLALTLSEEVTKRNSEYEEEDE
tara:strand:+ start:405 stop:605 length:201 start_codon:yes stop_codon:yes gene_type:complete